MLTDRVTVQFEGEGSGVCDLSWGQAEIWSVMVGTADSLPMGGARVLPPGQTVADVADGLSYLMSRHQALRTTLRLDPGGRTRQVVHDHGEITLEVVDAGDDDPGQVAAAVAAGYRARPFDYETEWPMRMAVITRGGTATHIAEMICHIAVDAFGLAALDDDFDRRGDQPGPVTAIPPMEQAIRQQGAGGRRAHQASMRYFERLAAKVPLRQFTPSADPCEPRFWQLTLDSPAGDLAARTLAARLGLSTSPVLLAAFAVALTELTTNPVAALHMVVSNRFRPGFAGSVSPVMQSCPAVIDVAGVPFTEVIRRAWQSSLGAYKHAYYDLARKDEAWRRAVAERGAEPDWSVIFNDRRVRSRDGDADAGLPALGDELSRTTLTWGERTNMPMNKVFLSLVDVPGTLSAELWADSHFLSPADMTGLLRRIESVLIDAASGPPERAVLITPGQPAGESSVLPTCTSRKDVDSERQRPPGTGHGQHSRHLAQGARPGRRGCGVGDLGEHAPD